MNFILLNTAQGGMGSILMIVALFVVFYFFMIRPQQKQQKKLKAMREALKKGDKVVTNGGIYGTVREVRETSVIVEVDRDVQIRVDKNCVTPIAEDANGQNDPNKQK
jgi:preprotein translocase subunit YajC